MLSSRTVYNNNNREVSNFTWWAVQRQWHTRQGNSRSLSTNYWTITMVSMFNQSVDVSEAPARPSAGHLFWCCCPGSRIRQSSIWPLQVHKYRCTHFLLLPRKQIHVFWDVGRFGLWEISELILPPMKLLNRSETRKIKKILKIIDWLPKNIFVVLLRANHSGVFFIDTWTKRHSRQDTMSI